MNTNISKRKLTITVDGKLLVKAKEVAMKKRASLSGIIENFLAFLVRPYVYCFKCGEKFHVAHAKICPKCGWLICPSCNACRCTLNEETAVAVFHMRRVIEDLMGGRLK